MSLTHSSIALLGLSVLAGAFAATGFAPFHILPAAIVALACLAWLCRLARSVCFAFALGWCFGLGYFAVGLHWVAQSFFVDPERFGTLAFPAIALLTGGLAIFSGIACGVARALRTGVYVTDAFVFAAAWTGTEWLRGTLLTGLPWNLVGHVWSVTAATMQLAAVVGVYGLTFLTACGAALAVRPFSNGMWRLRLAASVLIIGSIWAAGQVRLMIVRDPGSTGIVVRMVQGNVPQALKWRPEQRNTILERYVRLTGQLALRPVSAVVWPETAIPFDLAGDRDIRQRVANVLPAGGILFAGALRGDDAEPQNIFNSIVAVTADGRPIMAYDKVHLVPFGEYVPFGSILPLRRLTYGAADLSAGHERPAIRVGSLPVVAPMICYESIFPFHGLDGDPPHWLLNVTNDAWFGRSAGPFQHLEIARFRAVEAGAPMIRVANTGISAMIDAFGRVRERIELEQTAILDVELPRRLPGATIYSRLGNTPLLVAITLIFLAAATRKLLPGEAGAGGKNIHQAAHGRGGADALRRP